VLSGVLKIADKVTVAMEAVETSSPMVKPYPNVNSIFSFYWEFVSVSEKTAL
jgi:hypothetical protein